VDVCDGEQEVKKKMSPALPVEEKGNIENYDVVDEENDEESDLEEDADDEYDDEDDNPDDLCKCMKCRQLLKSYRPSQFQVDVSNDCFEQ